jgi:predicted lysophospholipase L1 biosynthesis ABC-type transport system permease subunit
LREAHWLRGVGRLRGGVTLAEARDQAVGVGHSLTEAFPDASDAGTRHGVAIVPFRDARVNGAARTAVAAVSAGALLFLLIACGNVATLLLARASRRRTDIAVRAALGAGRLRLLREHLLESLILAVTGGALGVALALGGQQAVARAVRYALDTSGTRDLQYLDPDALQIGGGTLALGMAVALATGLLFGLIPAWSSSRASPVDRLRRAHGVGRDRASGDAGRSALVSAQLALTLVLLSGAGLMGSTFARLAEIQSGFTHGNVLTLAYDRGPGVSDAEQHVFLSSLLDRLGALPGVESA